MFSISVYKSDDNKTKYYTFRFEDKDRCDYAFNSLDSELRDLVVSADDNSYTLDLSKFDDALIEEGMKQIFIVNR
jgi:hypothetical protein